LVGYLLMWLLLSSGALTEWQLFAAPDAVAPTAAEIAIRLIPGNAEAHFWMAEGSAATQIVR
jgi:hypothetical protein